MAVDQVGGTEWVREQREIVCAQAQDQVARARMKMAYRDSPGYRFRPVLEPLPPMTSPEGKQ